MPKLRHSIPSYSLHKSSGQAVVRLSGRDVYLGPFGSPESRERQDRFVAERLADGQRSPDPRLECPADSPLTVVELIVRYLEFAEGHYRKGGVVTPEFGNMQDALRPLRQLYGETPARDFGPKRLKTVRQRMVDDKLSRGVVNRRAGRIARMLMFKGTSWEELLRPDVHQALRTALGLQRGDPRPGRPSRTSLEQPFRTTSEKHSTMGLSLSDLTADH